MTVFPRSSTRERLQSEGKPCSVSLGYCLALFRFAGTIAIAEHSEILKQTAPLYTTMLAFVLPAQRIHFVEAAVNEQANHMLCHLPNGHALALFAALPQRRIHDPSHRLHVVLVLHHHALVRRTAPQTQRALRHLVVRRAQTLRDPLEQHVAERQDVLRHQVLHDVLDLVQEAQLLPAVARGPVLQQRLHNLRMRERAKPDGRAERVVLRHVQRHAVGQLDVVLLVARHLVQRDQRLLQRLQVLGTDRHREAVDDRRQNLQQLRDAAVHVRLVEELVERVVDDLADRRAAVRQLAVDAVCGRLETLALARVHRIEERDQTHQEGRGDPMLSNGRVDLRRHDLGVKEHTEANQRDQDLVEKRKMTPLRIAERVLVVLRHVLVRQLRLTPRSHTHVLFARLRTEQPKLDAAHRLLEGAGVVEERAVGERGRRRVRLGVHYLQDVQQRVALRVPT